MKVFISGLLIIAGKEHFFNREKLGKQFNALKKGEIIEIDADKEMATSTK